MKVDSLSVKVAQGPFTDCLSSLLFISGLLPVIVER